MNTNIIKISALSFLAAGQIALANDTLNDKNLTVDEITYLQEEETTSLDIDTEAYLPEDFNPYASPANVLHVSYIDEADVVELGFDTRKYLPEGFNPYKCEFDIHSIEYIDENDLFELDFDTRQYLPENFDANIGR
ncbi:MAG: hypothetical protein KJO16_06675 [Muriicola sp.]|nr:hypothetical protein [Muriicola sp.]